ncbi:MAG: hypothetical protein KJ941_10270 [Bacteroidetes bacterium]|nr:hypothetical protein [Bacteroidota bacterium]
MSIPIPNSPNIHLFELESSINWFDEDDIFYSVSKKVPRTFETMSASAQAVKNIFAGKKYCVIVESTNLSILDKKTRMFVTSELGQLYKAIAVVSPKPMSRVAGDIIYSSINKVLPRKSFKNVNEAKEWLKNYK